MTTRGTYLFFTPEQIKKVKEIKETLWSGDAAIDTLSKLDDLGINDLLNKIIYEFDDFD